MRILALVALLCTASLQLQEAGHGHALHDSYAECLLCKGSGPVAVVDNTATSAVPAAPFLNPVACVAPLRLTPSQPFLARGPPAHS